MTSLHLLCESGACRMVKTLKSIAKRGVCTLANNQPCPAGTIPSLCTTTSISTCDSAPTGSNCTNAPSQVTTVCQGCCAGDGSTAPPPATSLEGKLIRCFGNATIYRISGGKKFALGIDEYNNLLRPPVLTVDCATIASYPDNLEAYNGKLLRCDRDSTIYKIKEGKRSVLGLDEWKQAGKPTPVFVECSVIDSFPDDYNAYNGKILQCVNRGTIYKISDGKKKVLSKDEYDAMLQPTPVAVNCSVINAIPDDFSAYEGDYLKCEGKDDIYLVEKGRKRKLTLNQWKDAGSPRPTDVTCTFLDSFPGDRQFYKVKSRVY